VLLRQFKQRNFELCSVTHSLQKWLRQTGHRTTASLEEWFAHLFFLKSSM